MRRLSRAWKLAPGTDARPEHESGIMEKTMDRKALKQEYKNTPRPMGVFRVHNTRDDRSFVGTSVNLPATLNGQLVRLRGGMHPNRELQNDWNTLGESAFIIEVLDELKHPGRSDYDPTEDLRVLRSLWLDRLHPSATPL
jgi:hypothetical protein